MTRFENVGVFCVVIRSFVYNGNKINVLLNSLLLVQNNYDAV